MGSFLLLLRLVTAVQVIDRRFDSLQMVKYDCSGLRSHCICKRCDIKGTSRPNGEVIFGYILLVVVCLFVCFLLLFIGAV